MNPAQLLQQGLSYLNAGRMVNAEQCAQKALSLNPKSTQANFLMGLALYYQGKHKTALDAFSQVVNVDPRNCTAWAHCAEIYMILNLPNKAIHALDHAIKYNDDTPNVQQMIAMVKSLLNEHETALIWYKKATTQQPNNTGFLLNHALCLMYLGELDDAQKMLEAIIKIQPQFPNAHWLMSGLKKAKNNKHIDAMQQLISTVRYRPIDLACLHYASGKEQEDLQLWKQAFESFSKGAAAKRSALNYDEQAEIQLFNTLRNTYTKKWFSDTKTGDLNSSPIFIVGQPRSGTTLIERVISAHSSVVSAGELRNFVNSIRFLTNHSSVALWDDEMVTKSAAVNPAKLGHNYLESVPKLAEGKVHFVDKLPSNFMFVPLILKALPNAKIIHMRRDPMDTCFSGFKQLFTQAYPYSYNLKEMARHHARYLKLMNTWRERFGHLYHEVVYEEFAANPEPNAKALLQFLGLNWEQQCLQFHEQKTAVTTASSVQVRQPAHTRSIGRWKNYQEQLQPMQEELDKYL